MLINIYPEVAGTQEQSDEMIRFISLRIRFLPAGSTIW